MKPPRRRYGLLAVVVTLIVLASLQIQFHHLKEDRLTGDRTFATTTTDPVHWRTGAEGLPRGIVHSNSDMYLRPLWDSGANPKNKNDNHNALLAMAVGISQMQNVDIMARKFLNQNYTVMLFHYDGNVDGWHNLEWSDKAIHILARNQTKWWFAKRFLHPDVVAIYGFIFLWDEDLGVDNFDPRRYLDIMVSEGLEITQPALDPDLSTDIHHRITIRNKMTKVHRRIYDNRASGLRAWHLFFLGLLGDNDLIHGWGLDMKLGYCAQGDRAEKVGVIDSEYVVHQGIPSLGGPSLSSKTPRRSLDLRTHIRRQSSAELEKFKERWNRAVREDEEWTDPFDT
uniref:Lysine ketoglutarate reductase trans-splicing related 1 n=1 Tax=Oryza glumipatula TaxID=40148 RepID=A0A0E0AET7_9ORYZ